MLELSKPVDYKDPRVKLGLSQILTSMVLGELGAWAVSSAFVCCSSEHGCALASKSLPDRLEARLITQKDCN